jgi:hypothetical protein
LAEKNLSSIPGAQIIYADIFQCKLGRTFDVISLSNVLEHIENRQVFLKYLLAEYSPRKILIRVPMFEREWLVPYKKELGLEWRLDQTHYTEYTQDEFSREMTGSGLTVKSINYKWGEIYAVTVPRIG